MAALLIAFARLCSPLVLAILIISFASSAANASFFNLLRQQMLIRQMRADLRLVSFALDRHEVSSGETVRATVSIANDGTLGATSSMLTFWAAAGSSSSFSNASRIATAQLGTLPANSRLSHVSTFPAPNSSQAGTYRIFASLETATLESNWQNNAMATTLNVTVASSPVSDSTSDSGSAPDSTSGSDSDSSFTSPPLTTVTCHYYASPTGTGNGLSPESPFRINNFWSAATPGKTLCLVDGTYQGSDNIITPPPGLSGTSTNPITVRALNDGGALLDGQFARPAVFLNNNDWWVLEGFNAKQGNHRGVITLENGSSNNILRRIVAWDAHIHVNLAIIRFIGGSSNNLIEDVGAFGAGRKTFNIAGIADSNNNVGRRLWSRYEGSIVAIGTSGLNISYQSFNTVCENCFGTWSGESMPEEYNPVKLDGTHNPNRKTNFELVSPVHILGVDHSRNNPFTCIKYFGSLAYVKATDRIKGADGFWPVMINEQACATLRHVMAFISPNNPGFVSAQRGMRLNDGFTRYYSGPTDMTAYNITSVRHSSDEFDENPSTGWDIQNRSVGNSLAAVSNPFADPPAPTGANLCKRWINGQVTSEPLWPWPMNQRIKDATASAGNYFTNGGPGCGPSQGNCTGKLGAMRTATDVTADIERLLGPIPQACKR